MTQALAAHLRQCDFDAALVADHAPVLHALVLAAQALPVSYRPENPGAEKTVTLRLKGAVVDRLGFGDFAVGPAADFFRRGQADANGIEFGDRVSEIKWARTIQGVPPVPADFTPPLAAPGLQFSAPVLSAEPASDSSRLHNIEGRCCEAVIPSNLRLPAQPQLRQRELATGNSLSPRPRWPPVSFPAS